MLKEIKNFIRSLNPDLIIQAPSRINIINPLDAVEGDFWMPSVAINGFKNPLSVFLYIKEIKGKSRLKIYTVKNLNDQYLIEINTEEILSKGRNEVIAKLNGENKLIYASIYRFYEMSSYFERIFL